LALVGCSGAEPTQAPETTTTPALVAATPLSDEAFRTATGCGDCQIANRSARIELPLTGRAFTETKLIQPVQRRHVNVALDDTGAVVDGEALQNAERAAVRARQGALDDELYSLTLSSTASATTVPVWIWVAAPVDAARKEDLLADRSLLEASLAKQKASVAAATGKVADWLRARGVTPSRSAQGLPAVFADVSSSLLDELGRVDGVVAMGRHRGATLASTAWFGDVKGPAAQMIASSAAGQTFCNGESTQPDSTGCLATTSASFFNVNNQWSTHTRWTTELVSATIGTRMAPGAANYFTDYCTWSQTCDGLNDEIDTTAAWEWCFSQTPANAMNRSDYYDSLKPGAAEWSDFAMDYYVKTYPYPFITTAAGNCPDLDANGNPHCISGDETVGNRGYNYLVVGASGDANTATTADDYIPLWSAWANPTTPHKDFELPHLLAPGVNVSSASVTGSGPAVSGTSASAPIVLGAGLLARTRDSNYAYWPEMLRSSILATATHSLTGARVTKLPLGSDGIDGAGVLNSSALMTVAASANYAPPNLAGRANGHYGKTYAFASDFPSGQESSDVYNITASTAGRLRVVIAWDSSTTGNASNGIASGDVPDADIDLLLWNSTTGTLPCVSSSYDSTWEICDVAVNAGDKFQAQLYLKSNAATYTYLGISWYNYTTASE
jgi:hypothetical protein